nr:hypothetical protein Ade03nite_38130 [Actinoplanes derwentensis]
MGAVWGARDTLVGAEDPRYVSCAAAESFDGLEKIWPKVLGRPRYNDTMLDGGGVDEDVTNLGSGDEGWATCGDCGSLSA